MRRLIAPLALSALLFGWRAPAGAVVKIRCAPSFQVVASPAVPAPGELAAVRAVGPNAAWAVGDAGGLTLAERWNGVSWTAVPTPAPGDSSTLFGLTAFAADDAWAVGAFDQGTAHHSLIEHWNGHTWSRSFTEGRVDLNGVDGPTSDDV